MARKWRWLLQKSNSAVTGYFDDKYRIVSSFYFTFEDLWNKKIEDLWNKKENHDHISQLIEPCLILFIFVIYLNIFAFLDFWPWVTFNGQNKVMTDINGL